MLSRMLTFIRFGPSFAYAIAATLLVSMALLAHYPSSALVWSFYITLLPVMREPAFLLLDAVGFETAMAMLVLAMLLGIHLAFRPQRYARARFLHAHVALLATGLGAARAVSAQAGLSGLSLPQFLGGDWSMLPTANSTPWVALFLFVAAACLASHAEIIRRIRLS